ncbi:MAG: ABC transporter permease [Treponema sp.]|nr:ABC transporter permease [Treponema sp.]
MANTQEAAQKEHWTKVITARHKLLDLHLRDVYRYRDLIMMFIKRDFVVQYKQTILGPLWYLIQPVMSSVVYIFVFGRLANIGTDGVPPLMFYFGSTMLWTYFTSCLTDTSNVFVSQQNIFSKVYFPRLTVPISIAAGYIIKLLIQCALLAVFYVYYVMRGAAVRPTWWVVAFPLIVLWIGTLGSSFGLIISSLTTKYRDLRLLLAFGIQLAMYATPVVYPLSEAPQNFFWIFYINPMSAPMELFRIWTYGAGSLPLDMLLVSLGVTAACAFLGLVLFVKNERSFVDVI